jgi:two-component system, NarL family, invasion response regulator UvrY
MIRLLVADDHAVVRRGVRQIVEAEPDMRVVGEAGSTPELLDLAGKARADLVVLDIAMPGPSGLEALKSLRQAQPHLRVVMLSIYPEDQYAARVIKAGASGYVTKEAAPEELVKAIRRAMGGCHYVSPSYAERTTMNLITDNGRPPHERLSDREFEVVRLLVSGKLVSRIASELFLSVKTVSTHKQKALEKLGIQSVAELTRYAIENRLLN